MNALYAKTGFPLLTTPCEPLREDEESVRLVEVVGRRARYRLLVTFLSTSWCCLLGQGGPSKAFTPLEPGSYSIELQEKLKVTGDRLTARGKERISASGALSAGGKDMQATIVWQLPDKVRLDLGSNGRTLIFDGSKSSASDRKVDSTDENLLESFVEDSVENFLFSVQVPGHWRVLAHDVRMDEGTTASYRGPWTDIFELNGVTKVRSANIARRKLFYFDSFTHYPDRVRYVEQQFDGARTRVEVVFGNWQKVNGVSVPGMITRHEDGKAVFVFTVASVAIGAGSDDAPFKGN